MSGPFSDPVALINPLQGTASDFDLSRGNCLPLVSRPWGMTAWSPQTSESAWLFDQRAPRLQGIRATHQPSPWMGDYGHFTLMAQTGRLLIDAKQRASAVRPADLLIGPDYLRALLWRYQTTIELTPTERCAALRVTFPAAQERRILLQTFAAPAGGEIVIDVERRTVSGWTSANSGGVTDSFACYFVAVFDQPFAASGCIEQTTALADKERRRGQRVGAFVEFAADVSPMVELRIATSFISIEQAWRNLEQEIGDASFDELRAATRATWNALLSRVEFEASERQRQTFYTCLYRTLLFPRIWHEPDADGRPIHASPYDGAVHPGVLYADNGFWDTFRTVYPLLALLYPERLAEMIEGWVQAAREGGWLPTWASPGYRDCMIGTHLDAVIADAYLKGVRDFDVATAYAAMRRDAFEEGDARGRYGRAGVSAYAELGYVPADEFMHAAARTQEYAYDDFCIAQLAQALGHEQDARTLSRRALSYRNTFDPAVGFMRGRLRDGSWLEPFDQFAWDLRAYIEGGAWQYSWAAPHDPAGLIALMGGDQAFVAKLERMLSMPPRFDIADYAYEIHEMTEMALADFGQYAHSNQPVHHVLYLFAAAGRPWLTQRWVRRVLDELYSPDPDGLPGDEDNGEMSAWYILSALGIYPLCPGQPSYVLGGPLGQRATLHLANGRTLVIDAPGNQPETPYVAAVLHDDQPHHALSISHEQLLRGGLLRFVMSDTPQAQPRAAVERPFSLSPYDE
jgi:predicted alpha-1,2-mannosidase